MKELFDYNEFKRTFPDDNHCSDYLYALKWSNGFHCMRCGCKDYWEVSPYKYKCRNCGYQSTVTAGTLFHHTHLALIKWFMAAWYLTNVNYKATAIDIKKLIDVGSVRTAQLVTNKLKSAMIRENFNSVKLKGTVEVSSIGQNYGKYKDVEFGGYVYLAVELVNKKVQRIKMAVYSSRDEKTFTHFIMNSVEDNSDLQLSFPMRRIGDLKNYNLPDIIKAKGISFKWKKDSYDYQYVENTIDDFVVFYRSMAYGPQRIREAAYEYTKRVNIFNL